MCFINCSLTIFLAPPNFEVSYSEHASIAMWASPDIDSSLLCSFEASS